MAPIVTVLTGDRPTGPLHLGHYVGSLANRVELQNSTKQYIMVADVQALTDNFDNPKKVHDNVFEVLLDYLSIGIDPEKSTIFIQSLIPQIAELAIFYLNFVTVARLRRNPTVKAEMQHRGYAEGVTAGFLMYPVHQAADITVVKANVVPVGQDQVPMVEQTVELVRVLNRTYGVEIFPEPKALISPVPRLPGLDGKAKMSKSLGNAIYLKDDAEAVRHKVMQMYTDPDHIRVSDPGRVEGNMVFYYLDVFDPDKAAVVELKAQYRKGGLGDVAIKKRLIEVLNIFLDPIRTRRAQLAQDPEYIIAVAQAGSERTLSVAQQTMHEVKQAMHLLY